VGATWYFDCTGLCVSIPARFMPGPLSTGHLHLSFPSHPPPPTHSSMSLFRPSHFPLGVIGIGVCSQTDSLASMLDQFSASLLEIFPTGSLFPLAKNCFVFEDSDGTGNLNLGDNVPGLVVIPNMMGNKKLYVGTLLADLCSHILGEFGRVVCTACFGESWAQLTGCQVHTLESPLGNEYLNSALFPTLPSSSEMPHQLENASDSLPSYNSQPELGASAHQSRAQANLNLKRNSSAGPGLSSSVNTNGLRQSTLAVPVTKKRNSAIGVASSPGRLYKVLGDFFLLSGRTEDATVWYASSK
jgi:trafficking protein particle complex subunit 9